MLAAEICGECLRKAPAFGRVLTAASYQFPLDAAIQRLKYGHDLTLVAPLAALLAGELMKHARPDLVVPMPLARARLRERGFNQAAELARWLGAKPDLVNKALRSLAAGDVIVVECTDPLSVIDIPNLARETGDTLEAQEEADGVLRFRIRKAGPPPEG